MITTRPEEGRAEAGSLEGLKELLGDEEIGVDVRDGKGGADALEDGEGLDREGKWM